MRIGFIGAGSMAAALARGIAEPALYSSASGERARALAQELGGTATTNQELVAEADAVFLCHKPKHLEEVAAQAGAAKAIVSIVAATPLAELERLYPERPVYRIMAGIPAEVGRGAICWVAGSRGADGPAEELRELLGRCGRVVDVSEQEFEPAMALMGCGPAFIAQYAQALIDAGERHGLDRGQAALLVTETLAASALYLERNDLDTRLLQNRVATPGGLTEKGLEQMARDGLPKVVGDAVDLIVGVARP